MRASRAPLVLAGALALTLLPWPHSATRVDPTPSTLVRRAPLQQVPWPRRTQDEDLRLSDDGVALLRSLPMGRQVLCPPIRFTALAVVWQQRGTGGVVARVAVGKDPRSLGRAGLLADDLELVPDVPRASDEVTSRGTDLLWVGEARCAAVALDRPAGTAVSGAQVVFLNTSGTAFGPFPQDGAAGQPPGPFAPLPAQALTRRPNLISREQWGADESLRTCRPSYARRLKMAFVHHTGGSNRYEESQSDDIVRAIYAYHTRVRGYCDIAYNFLIDRFGRVFIGRAGGPRRPVIPEGTTGFNKGSAMIAVIGNYDEVEPPAALLRTLKRTLAWRLDVAHVPPDGWARMTAEGGRGTRFEKGTVVRLRTISAHRDTAYTACPGRYLFRKMREIRRAVYRIGLPKIFRPRRSPSSITPGSDAVRIRAQGSGILDWSVDIVDDEGQVVRRYRPTGGELDIRWKGMVRGDPASPGVYAVVIEATATDDGEAARPAVLSVTVNASSA